MSKRPKDDSVGPWAAEKLEALGQYLDYYTKVLKNQRWCEGTIFVDAFAGPGTSQIRDKGSEDQDEVLYFFDEFRFDEERAEFIKGSPRVALEIANPFSHYVFIDSDPERVRQLQALRDEYGLSRSFEVRPGDANSEIEALLSRPTNWRSHRGVCFLDPWGMQLPWETVERLARTKAIEVIINFPLMGIQRLLPKSGEIGEGWRRILTAYFGSTEWRHCAYEEVPTLFGPEVRKYPDADIRLLNWYRKRLKGVFGHVSTARLIRNTRGGHLYYLVWAGPHEMGLKGANYILGKGEKVRLR